MSESMCAAQLSSLSFGLSQPPFQFGQFSVYVLLSFAPLASHSTGWWLIFLIRQIFTIWVLLPWRSFTDKAGGKGDLSDNWNAAAPVCWNSDQDAFTIASVFEMHRMAVICRLCAWYSSCVACAFRLPCHIYKMLWTLPVRCNNLSSASRFISEWFSVFVVSNGGSSPANILLGAWANCLSTAFLHRVSPVVFDRLQLKTTHPWEYLASTPTQCGMIENMSHATWDKSVYFECVSSCWHHQAGITGIQNVLLITIRPEWESLIFGSTRPQFFGDSGGEFKWSNMEVHKCVAGSLRLGLVSATSVGIKYSASLVDESYGSNDDWPDTEAVAGGKSLLHCTPPGIMTIPHLCLAQNSFSTYMHNASWYWVVYNVLSPRSISMPCSHFQYDRNRLKGSKMCAEINNIAVIEVSSG